LGDSSHESRPPLAISRLHIDTLPQQGVDGGHVILPGRAHQGSAAHEDWR
jgi:hypothetical protein